MTTTLLLVLFVSCCLLWSQASGCTVAGASPCLTTADCCGGANNVCNRERPGGQCQACPNILENCLNDTDCCGGSLSGVGGMRCLVSSGQCLQCRGVGDFCGNLYAPDPDRLCCGEPNLYCASWGVCQKR